jgi:hypothetical protein
VTSSSLKKLTPPNDSVVSRRVRWFAIATGLLIGAAGALGLGAMFVLYPAFLVLGAIIQPRFRQLGRGLICFGALLVTFWVFDIGFLAVRERHSGDRLVFVLSMASVLLVILCDLAIVREELKIRHISASTNNWIQSSIALLLIALMN